MRIFFCANQISLCIASALNTNDSVIFFDPVRCDIKPYLQGSAKFISYSRYNLLLFLIKNWFRRPTEISVPHMLWGRLIRLYCYLGQTLSVIDDGLDTFREKPRNLNPDLFEAGTNYYTFNYDFPLAGWLAKFKVMKVCPINNLQTSSRPQIDLHNIEQLVIDSPGVEAIKSKLTITDTTLLVKHANPNKTTFRGYIKNVCYGNEFALEKSISGFNGNLVIGESMTAVYALSQMTPSFKLIVCINENQISNLRSLVTLIRNTSFAELYLTKNPQ